MCRNLIPIFLHLGSILFYPQNQYIPFGMVHHVKEVQVASPNTVKMNEGIPKPTLVPVYEGTPNYWKDKEMRLKQMCRGNTRGKKKSTLNFWALIHFYFM